MEEICKQAKRENMSEKKYKRVTHFFQRSKELGLNRTLQRIWTRSVGWLSLSFESLWWGFMARKVISDSSLLAHTTGNWRTVDDFLGYLGSHAPSSFIFPHESDKETVRILGNCYPQYLSDVIASADAVSKNQVKLLGHIFEYPMGIDWQSDPVTKWHWPSLYRKRMKKYIGAERPVDLILFWELNRHQHFISLGIAYWITGKECYVDAFIEQIKGWIEANPLQHSINWYYPLEVSIRLIAWTTAFQFFRTSHKFQQEVGKDFIKSLWQQADFLRHHLQPIRTENDIPNNHMVAELTGLIVVGTAFPEFIEATEWRETGLRLLIEQAEVQTYADGVHKEQASGYHRFVTELLLLVVVNNKSILKKEPIFKETLEGMLDHILFSLSPDGTNPMWGDTDFGRTLGLGLEKDFWDFRHLLSTGAVLFARPDWKFAAGHFDAESFWLLGMDGLQKWDELTTELPQKTSRAFPQAGQYIIRDSWNVDTDVAFFRCGEFGLGGEGHCAHAHSDLLSFTLWINGQPLLVDSGTYIYHGAMRDYFRLTSAHNTVMVDGLNQAIPQPNFNWREISDAKNIAWSEKSVTGAVNYTNVEFTRKLSHPKSGVWVLDDSFSGKGEHRAEWFFNFAPGFDFELEKAEQILKVMKDGIPFVNLYLPKGEISAKLDEAWYSRQYAVKESTHKLNVQWQGELKEQGEKFNWKFEFISKRKGM